jgi:hypothetical protein
MNIEYDTKITVADILDLPDGQSLYEQLDEMFPYFSSITFYDDWFSVIVAKGNDSRALNFNDLDPKHKQQFTVDLDDVGFYIEVSFNDLMQLMTVWKRGSKLNQLGL